jgi:hypothetical protein
MEGLVSEQLSALRTLITSVLASAAVSSDDLSAVEVRSKVDGFVLQTQHVNL